MRNGVPKPTIKVVLLKAVAPGDCQCDSIFKHLRTKSKRNKVLIPNPCYFMYLLKKPSLQTFNLLYLFLFSLHFNSLRKSLLEGIQEYLYIRIHATVSFFPPLSFYCESSQSIIFDKSVVTV